MTTSNVRITGDTSGLTTSLERVGDVIDREREKIDDFSNSIRNIPNVNGNNAYNNNDVANVINNLSSQTQVIQQQTGNNFGGNGNNVINGGGGTNIQGGGSGSVVSALTGGNVGGALTSVLAKMGPAGLAIAAIVGAGKVGKNLEKKWEDKLPSILDTYNSLSDTNGTAEENSTEIRKMYKEVNRVRNADDVRFNTNDYLATMRQLKEFGVSGWEDSLNSASNVLKFENAGMGSRAQLLELEGMSRRFNQDNALNKAYAGLNASGMEKGQFDEFLSSMESIFEDGISKGIVKGYDEISSDLTLLETLSGGNKLWQGQYGAQNLQQMNSAVENATTLSSVNDVLMYQAINEMDEADKMNILKEKYDPNNGYINNMMILEQGITTDTIGPIFDKIKETGGSRQDQIERFMRVFGFNYSKASDVYDIAQNYTPEKAQDIVSTINSYETDVSADSIDRQLMESRENISNKMADIGNDITSINNTIGGIYEQILGISDERSESEEIKMIPVSGAEVDTWNELVANYDGPLSQADFYSKINEYFNDSSMREWADTLNFQNSPGLKAAWDSKNGTEFFTTLFDESKYTSTAYGPMTMDDWNSISGDRDFKNRKNIIRKNTDFETNRDLIESYLAARREFDPSVDPTMQNIEVLLREIAAFAVRGEVVVKSRY